MKIAVIGSGIAGLSAAWLLAQRYQVTLFEADRRAGGHSHAVDITLDGQTFPVDTGFLVCNAKTYPNLLQLFALTGVGLTASDMSFSVNVPSADLEWAGSDDLRTLFAQKRNLLRPRFWQMISEILRFNRAAPQLLERSRQHGWSLGQLLHAEGYGQTFADWYLLPMGAAIWSTPVRGMLDFPAESFLRFCMNHGLLQVNDRPQWQTVTGSSREYVRRLVAGIGDVRLATPVHAIQRMAQGVHVQTDQGTAIFDQVVLATHSDQSLQLLQDADAEERAVLAAVRYAPNRAVLHRDARQMPRRRSAWAAWNYMAGANADAPVAVTYWLNRLQPLPCQQDVFVTLNPVQDIDPALQLASFDYAHPQLDAPAYAAQQQLPAIQGKNRVWFCGAWTGYGFHEDGLKSGMRVARALQAPIPWQADWS